VLDARGLPQIERRTDFDHGGLSVVRSRPWNSLVVALVRLSPGSPRAPVGGPRTSLQTVKGLPGFGASPLRRCMIEVETLVPVGLTVGDTLRLVHDLAGRNMGVRTLAGPARLPSPVHPGVSPRCRWFGTRPRRLARLSPAP
jgi:hypothetical protein